MTRDELEFQISQSLDGTLSAEENAALQERLANDAEARELLAEYRRLNKHLARALPLPAVNWDRLAEHLSGVIADADAANADAANADAANADAANADAANADAANADAPAVAGRIGSATWRSRLAIAAGIIIAVSAGLLVYDAQRPRVAPTPPGINAVNSSAVVIGPRAEPATGPVVQQITVGPSPALAAKGDSWRYAEGVVTRPSSATIAGAMKPHSAHVR
jgi:anti-sigma factor RsiW